MIPAVSSGNGSSPTSSQNTVHPILECIQNAFLWLKQFFQRLGGTIASGWRVLVDRGCVAGSAAIETAAWGVRAISPRLADFGARVALHVKNWWDNFRNAREVERLQNAHQQECQSHQRTVAGNLELSQKLAETNLAYELLARQLAEKDKLLAATNTELDAAKTTVRKWTGVEAENVQLKETVKTVTAEKKAAEQRAVCAEQEQTVVASRQAFANAVEKIVQAKAEESNLTQTFQGVIDQGDTHYQALKRTVVNFGNGSRLVDEMFLIGKTLAEAAKLQAVPQVQIPVEVL